MAITTEQYSEGAGEMVKHLVIKPWLAMAMGACILYPALAQAGAGHDHGESAFGQAASHHGPVQITPAMRQNLGIETATASLSPMGETLDLLAFTELLPEKQAQIMARFKGRVTELFVQVGQAVKKGQPLLTVDPIIQSNRPVTLHSPIDGFVLSQNSVPGLVVAEGDSMMLIGDASQILVRGVGYETPAIQRLSVGQPVEVHLDIAPEVPLHGSIQRTNLQLDPITRTFSVYALIETPGEDFLPNLQGTMEVQLSEPSPRLTVPRRALVGDDGNYAVYVLEGDRAERRPVELGIHNGTHVEIIHGVLPDEEVITQGSYQLQYVPGTANAGHDAVHPDHKEHDHTDHTHDEGHKHDGEQGE